MAVSVTSIEPADGAHFVLRDSPVTVRIANSAGSTLVLTDDTQAEWLAGTLANVDAPETDLLRLAGTAFLDDFDRADDPVVGNGWTEVELGGTWAITSNTLRCTSSATRGFCVREQAEDDCEVLVSWPTTGATRYGAVILRYTDANNFYMLQYTGANIQFYRRVAGVTTQLGSNVAKTLAIGLNLKLRVRIYGSTFSAKVWDAAGVEPAAWDGTRTDSAIASGPYAGVSSYTNPPWWDDFTLYYEPPAGYEASGTWTSTAKALDAAVTLQTIVVEWDSDEPASTSVMAEFSLTGGAWTAILNAGKVTGFTPGDTAVAQTLGVRLTLATSDAAVTPSVTALRVRCLPVNPWDVVVTINGMAYSAADGTLEVWNTAAISGGAVVEDYDDLYFRTKGLPWYGGEDAEVTVAVGYAGSPLSSTTFITESMEPLRGSGASSGAWWMAYEGSPTWCMGRCEPYYYVCPLGVDYGRGDHFYYVLPSERVIGDAYYWVAHPFEVDVPSAGVVGIATPTDLPAAGIVQGWARTDGMAAGIVQGWIRADTISCGAAGVRVLLDAVASGIRARLICTDAASGGVVLEVNRRNKIDVIVVDVHTAETLADLGMLY
ncbi:MAG: hypothetical protein V2A73_13930 [Pseudomonadota bacterium]